MASQLAMRRAVPTQMATPNGRVTGCHSEQRRLGVRLLLDVVQHIIKRGVEDELHKFSWCAVTAAGLAVGACSRF